MNMLGVMWTTLYSMKLKDRLKTYLRTAFFYSENILLYFLHVIKRMPDSNDNEVHTHLHYHFGDNVIHILFLSKVALQNPHINFFHYCKKQYINELEPYVKELSNLYIKGLESRPYYSLNVWKNFRGDWERAECKNNVIEYYIDYFERISKKISVDNPLKTEYDFLFDGELLIDHDVSGNYEYLVVNSIPLSGQFNLVSKFDEYIFNLSATSKIITTRKLDGIPCTTDFGYSMFQIGCLSKSCKNLLMVSTGPSWYPLNTVTYSKCESILILLDTETISIGQKVKSIRCI